jgi:Mor family transcriptional regulator
MSQHEMFDDDELDASILEHACDLPEDSATWPALLLELHGVIHNELGKSGISQDGLALKMVLSISEYMGGMQVYLPRGDKLKQQIRDMEIYQQFNGRNIAQLTKRHHLTNKRIYEIIARMRRVELQRRQFSLFD